MLRATRHLRMGCKTPPMAWGASLAWEPLDHVNTVEIEDWLPTNRSTALESIFLGIDLTQAVQSVNYRFPRRRLFTVKWRLPNAGRYLFDA